VNEASMDGKLQVLPTVDTYHQVSRVSY